MLDTRDYNALDLAQPTNFKSMLRSGEFLWGTSCRIPHEEAGRIVATLPHHFCFLDGVSKRSARRMWRLTLTYQEHCPLNPTLMVSLVKIIQLHSGGAMVPYVRIPPNALDYVNYVLNAGAGGIVMPHVQNAKQARDFVRMARFPPLGERSYPPMALLGRQTRTKPGQSVYDVWNEHAAVLCQIEDVDGVENIESIARVAGGELSSQSRKAGSRARMLTGIPLPVDALMVGVGDLRCSLGLETGSQDGDEPVFLAALDRIQAAADANGLPVLGFAMSPEILKRRIKLGWKAFIIHSDGSGVYNSGMQALDAQLQVVAGMSRG